jgi:purine nucleosidase
MLKPLLQGLTLMAAAATTLQAAPRDLIIDTDPGADDVRLEKTSRNARLAREWAGREDIPVYAGAGRPLVRAPIYAADVHGEEGLTGVAVHEPKQPLAEGNAVQYLVDTLGNAKPHSITLAMLGPQTNLALALIQQPEIANGIKEVVVMGGAHFNGGNITPAAEFNLYADPHAAEVVLASGVQLTYLPLDVTHKVLTSDTRLKQLAAVNNQASKKVVDILQAYVKHDMDLYGMPGGPVHDASVIAYLLKPELFSGRRIHLSVDSREGPTFGQTIADWYGVLRQSANVMWVNEADAQGFFDLLSARLARLP